MPSTAMQSVCLGIQGMIQWCKETRFTALFVFYSLL